jgi:Domain of unknown function (DUF1887)
MPNMGNPTIQNLLERRGAWLKGSPPSTEEARARMPLVVTIGENYGAFEHLRDDLLNTATPKQRPRSESDDGLRATMLDDLVKHHIVRLGREGTLPADTSSMRFLSGGWLEELAWHAAIEAGAHEAVFGQVLGWNFGGYSGENEIDVICRQDESLIFVSCKALKSELVMSDKKHRARLMDAIHEADNLADHFGRPNEKVAVIVTTDLHDEERGVARYSALMGKAAVLRVRVVSLEDLGWPKLVSVMADLLNSDAQEQQAHESN